LPTITNLLMKPVLVLLHIFYTEQIPYFIGKMKNIGGTEWDLVVTGALSDAEKAEILSFKPETVFMTVENRGYDIWPFIAAIKAIDLSKYSFVLKLHTKNVDSNRKTRINGASISGREWRDTMVDALLGSPAAFLNVKKEFEKEDTGLVFSLKTCILSKKNKIADSQQLSDELERLDIFPLDYNYCGGTTFAVRAETLQYLKSDKINCDIFPLEGTTHSDGTITHSYERILCIAVTAQGYKIRTVPQYGLQPLLFRCKRGVQPALEWIFSINHHNGQGKYLTLLGFKFRLGC